MLPALAAAAASLLLPAHASASTVHVLPTSNGAYVSLGSGSGLFVSRGRATASSSAGGTMTSYSTAARADLTGVRTRFGRLGRIDLHFKPTGQPSEQKPEPFCKGEPQITWEGVCTGTVELRGRFGFHSVRDRTFAKKGSFSHTPRQVCRFPDQPAALAPEGGNGILLWAGACDGRGLSVQSERPRSNGFAGQSSISYSAYARVRVGRVQVGQDITVPAAPETFSFDEALTNATISPPAPFHGTGTLTTGSDGTTTWFGSLSATILGRQVSLSGPGFVSQLRSFPKAPHTSYLFAFDVSCQDQKG